jgi:hypothetical protein
MSIYRPEELRFAKLDSVDEERRILANYYWDIIREYGFDVTYYRRDTTFNPSALQSDIIYGYQDKVSFTQYNDIRTYCQFTKYDFLIGLRGFIPDDNVTFYFGIPDFAVCFAEKEGQFRQFDCVDISGWGEYDKNIQTVPFSSEICTGLVTFDIRNYPATGFSGGTVTPTSISAPTYQVVFNKNLRYSFSADYAGSYYSPNVRLSYERSKTIRNGHPGIRWQTGGSILYSDIEDAGRFSTEIKPNVGDVVKIDFHTEDGHTEQYEITEVISRKPTNQDGLNPMLGKYVWKCEAVRRIPSQHENLDPEDGSRQNHEAQMDFNENRAKVLDNQVHNWTSSTEVEDDVYGRYDRMDAFKGFSEETSSDDGSMFNSKQLDLSSISSVEHVSGYFRICGFEDGTSILTDGYDLYYAYLGHYPSPSSELPSSQTQYKSVNITNNRSYAFGAPEVVSSLTSTSGAVPEMMYLRVNYGNLYFSGVKNEAKITNFSETANSYAEYPADYWFSNGNYVAGKDSYIFQGDKFMLYSKNRQLIAVNRDNAEGKIAKIS